MNTIVQNLQKILEIKNELSGVLGSSSTPFSDYPSEFRKIKTNLIESEQKLDNIKMFSFDTKEETCIDQKIAEERFAAEYNCYPNASAGKGTYSDSSGREYKSYILTADEDFDIWIEDSEMSSATAQPRFLTVYQVGIPAWTSSKGTRYKIERSTLSTLPHKDTPLSIKKGQVVIFSSFGGNSENPNGYDDFMFHTNKVWFTKTIYRNTPYIKYSRSTVDLKPQEKEVLFIYTPCKGGYIKYRYSHVYNKTINCDSWHLGIVSICDDMMNELYDISHIGEIEMAVKLSGRVDYMGGLAHGDEVVVDNGFTINNVEYSLSNLIEEFGEDAKPVTNVMCRQTSHMYDPALSATLDNVSTLSSIATHQKTLVWNKDSDLSIGQTIEWNKNDTLFDGAFPMLTPRKYNVESNGISSVITDTLNTLLSTYDIEHAWDKASITNRSLNTGISSVTVFGKESGIRFHAECSQYVNDEPVSTQFSLRDNGGNNYNKIYFLMNNDDKAKNISNGDIWKSNCLISITK